MAANDVPRPMALQGAANMFARALLRVPVVSQAVGKWLIVLYVVGRKSGKRYTLPVAYTRHDGVILIGTPFKWGKNVRSGEPLTVRYKGRLTTAEVEVVADEAGVVRDYAVISRLNNQSPSSTRSGWTATVVLTPRICAGPGPWAPEFSA